MGSRALTFVYNTKLAEDVDAIALVNLYRQYDGYPKGHGKELAKFLNSKALINGYNKIHQESGGYANGMGCLAAQLVAHFKKSIGGIYMYPVTDVNAGQDYEYHVYPDAIVVIDTLINRKVLFNGSWFAFRDWVKNN
jgi:hypothetical protein